MAVVKNITPDDLSVGTPDGGLIARAGKEVDVPDADFVDRAWPTSTWKLVKKPGKGRNVSIEDAIVFTTEPAESAPESNTEESA